MTTAPPAGALRFAHELADAADALTTAGRGAHGRDVAGRKGDGTWVTDVDRAVERRLRTMITERFPDHAVLGEEDGRSGPPDAPTWVLDPIDATANYVRGNPVWATLVGLQVDGDDVLGVVSAPALGHRWAGVVGEGATEDGRPIRVSDVARLGDAEVSFGGLDWFRGSGRWRSVERLVDATTRVRGYGDFWAHCLVAAGSTELAVEAAVSTWDLCAVRAVVRAAGGRCTALDGTGTSSGGDVLSSNGLLHEAALGLVAGGG